MPISCIEDLLIIILTLDSNEIRKIPVIVLPFLNLLLEYASMMGHMINVACLKQRFVAITLLDLKIAF